MPSTYTVNLGIEKPATGEQSGTWGDTTNVNFDIIDQAVNGSERVTLTSAGTSGSPNDLNIVNGSTTSSEGRNKWIEIYSASDLGGSAYVRLVPNDAEKILFIRNSLAGSQSVLLFQGTYNASNDLEIPAGVDMVVKFDGAGASATVTDVFTKLRATEITTPTLTAGTADINGGSVDGATIGAASASTGAFTTLTASTNLNIASSTTVDGVLDEDDMSSDSATKLATQQSIKAYVDSQVGTVDTLAEILANGNTSGANNLIIDSGQALTANTINETTAGSGVTIDSVLLKDDVVNATDIETSNISANDGTAAATIANSTGNFTITNFISNSVDIGGGAIDGTNIGASSAATGAFTTLSTTSDATLGNDILMTNDSHIQWGSASSRLEGNSSGTDTLKLYTNSTENLSINGSAGGSVVVNEGSSNLDFRVESTNNANMLFVDAGTDRVGVGTNAPVGIGLTVDGGASVGTYFYGGTNNRRQLTFTSFDTASLDAGHEIAASSVSGRLLLSASSVNHLQIDAVSNTTVFNENSTDQDFRVESDGASHMLFVDAGNNRVGIGEASPDTPLHITTSSSGNVITIESTDAGTAAGPSINLFRNSSSPANNDLGPAIFFRGDNSVGGSHTYANIFTQYTDVTDGAEDANIMHQISIAGTSRTVLGLTTSEVSINDESQNVDFRVESDSNSNMLMVNAGGNRVGIGRDPNIDVLEVAGNIKLDADNAEINLKSGVAGTTGAINWTFNTDATDYASIKLEYDSRATTGLHVDSGYPITLDYSVSGSDGLRISSSGTLEHRFNSSGATFNENSSSALDFRVESDSNANMLFVDAGAEQVIIGSNSGTGLFNVVGSTGGYIAELKTGTVYQGLRFAGSTAYSNGTFELTPVTVPGSGTANMTTYFKNFGTIGSGGATRHNVVVDGNFEVNPTQEAGSDFRVSSTNQSNMLFVDSGNDLVNIGDGISSDCTLNVGVSTQDLVMRIGGTLTGADGVDKFIRFQGKDTSAANRYADIKLSPDNNAFYIYNPKSTGPNHYGVALYTNNDVVINDQGSDPDFRVESDSKANMLFIDGGTNYLCISSNVNRPDSSGSLTESHAFVDGKHYVYSTTDWGVWASNAAGIKLYFRDNTDSTIGSISYDAGLTGVTYNTTSDRRLKENIEPIADGTDKLMAMNPVRHTWKSAPEVSAVHGFIAQEMQEIVPEAVSGTPDGEEMMSMDYGRITPVLVAALQDAHRKIEALEKRLSEMEAK
jgi:hypothetical protein